MSQDFLHAPTLKNKRPTGARMSQMYGNLITRRTLQLDV